ncbi:hypothetical protein ACROYT_G022047 [Oculina patagonica]
MESAALETASDEDHESSLYQVSGCYKVPPSTSPPPVLIEHCCLRAPGNTWNIAVKCRPLLSHCKGKTQKTSWRNITEVYPKAKVKEKHNDIEVILPPLQEDIEIAAFGIPGNDDQKRMQMAIFGKKPTQGRDWKIRVYLIDDSTIAFKNVCQKEEELGNRLLTALAGLFVSNSDEDIRIEFTALEPGWQIKGNKEKTIKSNDVWHTPENATDFPRCHFDIIHVDKTKQSFFCGITASHEKDRANSEVVAYFEHERGKEISKPSDALQSLKNTSFYISNDSNVWLPLFFVLASGFKSTRLKDKRAPGNTWNIAVKCRPLLSHCKGKTQKTSWRNVTEVYPKDKVKEKHNDIEVILPPLQEDIEIAAFGIPGNDDQKRMQMAIFGKKPTQGKDWKIRVYLIDDSTIAFKNVCQKEEELGNRLLTALAGLFVSNSDEDIRIEFTALEPGWQIKGNKEKTIKSNDVWHTPENATDFPRCHFDIIHVDKTKQSFFCGITASHEKDRANSEVVAYFEHERGKEISKPSDALQSLKNTSFYISNDTNVWLPLFFVLASGFKSTRLKGSIPHFDIIQQLRKPSYTLSELEVI